MIMACEDVIKGQRQYLDILQAISRKPILMKIREGAIPEGADYDEYMWVDYKMRWNKVTVPIYTRTILTNEVCFDPDVKEWHVLKEELQKLYDYSKANNIPLQFAFSGGNGIHGHLFLNNFEIYKNDLKNAEKYDVDLPKIVRDTVLNQLLKDAGASRTRLKIDSGKVTFDKGSKGSMVREFGTTRPDGGFKTLIQKIPDTREEAQLLPLVFPQSIEQWTLPENYIEVINPAIADAIKKAEECNDYNTEIFHLEGNDLIAFPCMKKLLKNGANSRYYGAVSITLLSSRCGLPWTTTEVYIRQFFDKCVITAEEIELRINNVKTLNSSDHRFSCRKVKEHFGEDICSFDKCVLCKKIEKIKAKTADEEVKEKTPENIKKLADEKMLDGTHIKFILETHQTMHAGDYNLSESLLVAIGDQSVLNSDGIHPKVSGGFGKGKTHCCKTMIHLVPGEYRLKTSLSDKAIYYMKIKPGTIIFSDDVDLSESLESVIKRATSNFQEGDTYTTVDKNREVQTLTIPPRVSWWLTSVDDNQSQQLLSRLFGGGVDESEKQDTTVTDFQLKQGSDGTVGLPINDDIRVCREIINQVKQQLIIVRIPFAQQIEWQDKSNDRNLAIFLDIIKSYAILNFKRRIVFEGALIAHPDDYIAAKKLYDVKAETQTTKYNEGELRLLRFIQAKQDPSVEIADIQRGLKLSQSRVYRLLHGRKDRLDSGLLAKEPSLQYEKVNLKSGDTMTTKGLYHLECEFNLLETYSGIVNLDTKAVDHYTHYYTTMSPLCPYKNDMQLINMPTIPIKMKNVQDTKNIDPKEIPKTINDSKNISLCENLKSGQSGHRGATDNEIGGHSSGIIEGIVAKVDMAKDEKNPSLCETPKSGHSGHSGAIINETCGHSGGISAGIVTKNDTNVANIPIVPKVHSKISFEEIEKYGNQWQDLKQTSINNTMAEFCIWYCGQHGGTPSSITIPN